MMRKTRIKASGTSRSAGAILSFKENGETSHTQFETSSSSSDPAVITPSASPVSGEDAYQPCLVSSSSSETEAPPSPRMMTTPVKTPVKKSPKDKRSGGLLGIARSPFKRSPARKNKRSPNKGSPISMSSGDLLGIQRRDFDDAHDDAPLDLPKTIETPQKGDGDDTLLGEENVIVFENSPPDKKGLGSIFSDPWRNNSTASTISSIHSIRSKVSSPSKAKPTYDYSSPEKVVHGPTASKTYIAAKDIAHSPITGLRYLIDKGSSSMNDAMKSRSRDKVKKVRVKESISWIKDKADGWSKKGVPANVEVSVKIFLLLLQPESRIFELIQLIYPTWTTTIGDILKMIPKKATEPALGSQEYEGVTRPKRRATAFTDLEMMASHNMESDTAAIAQGEILVAIPVGYTSKHMVGLAKQILANPRIQKLMEKTNPLSAKRKKRRPSGSNKSKRTGSRKGFEEMEAVKEETSDTPDINHGLHRAMVHAAAANAEASDMSTVTGLGLNDSVAGISLSESLDKNPAYGMSDRSVISALATVDGNNSFEECDDQITVESRMPVVQGCFEDDDDASLEGSFTSWSQSFDQSVSRRSFLHGSPGKVLASSSLAQRQRQSKYVANIKRIAAISLVFVITRYYFDPKGFAAKVEYEDEPMGLFGFVHFLVSLALLIKSQRFLVSPNLDVRNSRCPFLQTTLMLTERVDQHKRVLLEHD